MRASANRLRTDLDLRDSFVLVYSGNLGVGHEFETLMQGVAIAREQVPAIRIVFFGSGARLAEVRQLTRDLGLEPCVTFAPLVPAEHLPESLGLADLGVVTLRKGFEGLMVPSKLLGYMARGIPVLYVGPPSDASELVSRHGCGYCVGTGDSATVARTIVEAYGNREKLAAMGGAGQQAYEEGMSRERAMSRYEDVLRRCLDAGRG
jgi:glycosyltransferase involved in cell wall biosynthesis